MYSISFVVHKFSDFSLPNVGGASKNPIKIIKSLDHKVIIQNVISFNGSPDFTYKFEQYFYKVPFLKLFVKTFFQNLLIIKKIISSFRVSDVIQIHHPHYGLTVVIIRKLFFKSKFIITKAHGTSIPELNANNYKGLKGMLLYFDSIVHFHIDKFVLQNSDKVVCSSIFQLNEMEKLYKVKNSSLVSIYNGFDPDFIIPRKINLENIRFVFCGRLVPKKNIHYAISLFLEINSVYENVTLDLVLGESNKIEDFNTYKSIMNLINHNSKINIHFDLSESDLYSLFSKCHIGLITSIGYESIPTVVFEMISNGLKVFSTFDWGIPEVLNKSSALNHNLEDDKGKILDFIETELSNFVKRDHSYDDYSIDNLANQYLKLYKDLIK